MTAEAILQELQRKGVTVQLHGDRVRLIPGGVAGEELRSLIRQHRPEILAALEQRGRARLTALLTTWVEMREPEWTRESVDQLKEAILDVFEAYPERATAWYQEWHRAHPKARLS